jgi:putative tricarboxylic transport membrane protein
MGHLIKSAEFWGGIFWFGLGIAVAWAGRNLGLGKLHEPGSGFMLFWLGLLMMGLAASVIVKAMLVSGPSVASLWAGTRWGRVLVVIAVLLAFSFLFETVGFIVGAFALLLVLMFFVDPVNWKIAIPVSALAVFGVWAALTKWLKIQLPAGVLNGWLG